MKCFFASSDTNFFSLSQISTSCLAGGGRPVTHPVPLSPSQTLTTRASGCAPPAPTTITPGPLPAPFAALPGLGECLLAPPLATPPPLPTLFQLR